MLSDQEIQAFREELVRPRSMNEGGGCGMNVMFKQIYHNHIYKDTSLNAAFS